MPKQNNRRPPSAWPEQGLPRPYERRTPTGHIDPDTIQELRDLLLDIRMATEQARTLLKELRIESRQARRVLPMIVTKRLRTEVEKAVGNMNEEVVAAIATKSAWVKASE